MKLIQKKAKNRKTTSKWQSRRIAMINYVGAIMALKDSGPWFFLSIDLGTRDILWVRTIGIIVGLNHMSWEKKLKRGNVGPTADLVIMLWVYTTLHTTLQTTLHYRYNAQHKEQLYTTHTMHYTTLHTTLYYMQSCKYDNEICKSDHIIHSIQN
jgi:hypothetical protein